MILRVGRNEKLFAHISKIEKATAVIEHMDAAIPARRRGPD